MLLLLFGYAFSWVFALLGLLVSSPEAANSVGFLAVFPLTFISSAFVPVDSMPAGLQWFAEINPFTVMVDAMRSLWVGAPAGNSVWGAFVWSLVILAVFAPIAVARYRRTAGRKRRRSRSRQAAASAVSARGSTVGPAGGGSVGRRAAARSTRRRRCAGSTCSSLTSARTAVSSIPVTDAPRRGAQPDRDRDRLLVVEQQRRHRGARRAAGSRRPGPVSDSTG